MWLELSINNSKKLKRLRVVVSLPLVKGQLYV